MRILAAGDIHGNKDLAEKLAEQAEKEEVDLVILNGDIVEEENPEGIVGPFVKKNKKVILVPGNHETIATTDFLAEIYGATNLHGYYIKLKDIGIVGFGGAQIGLNPITDKEIYDNLKRGFDKIKNKKTKIIVTHVHPSDTQMEKFSQFVQGSKGLKKIIDILQPNLVICGHVHEAEGIEEKIGKTLILNVGKNGKIIEI